jgi:hypothetical protein
MTFSKEYREADAFKRMLLRQIAAGKHLIKKGWDDGELPADVRTLESVKKWYDIFLRQQAGEQI